MRERLPAYAIIFAADLPTVEESIGQALEISTLVDGVKVGTPFFLLQGTAALRRLRQATDLPLIADLKVADIGLRNPREDGSWQGTNQRIVEAVISAGADYVICHGIVGVAAVEESIETAHEHGGRALLLPYMTHDGASLFFDHPVEYTHVRRELRRLCMTRLLQQLPRQAVLSDLIVALGEQLGADGYIAPANRPGVMRRLRRQTPKLLAATGIGRQGGKLETVFGALGPQSAAIVGSAIYQAANPHKAALQCRSVAERLRGAR